MFTIETDTTKKTMRAVRFIYRCKHCGAVVQRQLLRCRTTTKPVGHVISIGYYTGEATRVHNASYADCACGKRAYGREVEGRVSTKHKCGAKCLSAKGPSCECSCGGANHGAGHSLAGVS